MHHFPAPDCHLIIISQRKEFESYLNENPAEKENVNAIKLTMDSLHKLETVTVSNGFMDNLNQSEG